MLDEVKVRERKSAKHGKTYEYRQAQIDLSIVAEIEVFIEAFRLGARLVLDIVGDYRGNFYTATEE